MSAFEHGYAVVVGVAGYSAQGLPPLPLAALNDAVDLARTLWDPDLCGYRADRVRLLVEEQATALAIRQGLDWLVDRCSPDDTAIVFFSGHGWNDGTFSALAAYDAWTAPPGRGMIPGDELANYFRAIPSGRLAVFLDSCFSGGLSDIQGGPGSGSASYGPPRGFDEGTYEKLCAGRGRVLLASSGPQEKSVISEDGRNSLFTSCLLRGLRGEAPTQQEGVLGIFDLFRFVSREVKEKSNRFQNPLFKGLMSDDFPITLQAGRKSPAEPSPPQPSESWAGRDAITVNGNIKDFRTGKS
jgi:hypothetical protein